MMRAACLAAALTGCAADDAPRVAPAASLLVRCPAPLDLPSRDLTGAEVEIMWGRDRSALRNCASRHDALAQTMETGNAAQVQ